MDDDIVGQMERRNRRARFGLWVGSACLLVGLVGCWTLGGYAAHAEPPGPTTVISALDFVALFVGPLAFGFAAANLTSSDNFAMRIGHALLAAFLSFVLLMSLAARAYLGNGGRFGM